MTPNKDAWEDCCDFCKAESDCEKLISRCKRAQGGASCEKCNTCEEFVDNPKRHFKKASEI